ncbi:hypothetical protein KC345_g2040 [Hortaea werneckii]|nr:hypothetical protein KC345_g2040 [Hortaea werneckii]
MVQRLMREHSSISLHFKASHVTNTNPSFPARLNNLPPIVNRDIPSNRPYPQYHASVAMISDASLYSLAIFLGSASMLMIVLYHFLEINAQDPKEPLTSERKADALPAKAR